MSPAPRASTAAVRAAADRRRPACCARPSWDASIADLREALRLAPQHENAWTYLARTLKARALDALQRGDNGAALRDVEARVRRMLLSRPPLLMLRPARRRR